MVVQRSIHIAAPPERVWRAIIEPALLEQWYAPGCSWEIPTLEVGATVRFYNTPDDIQVATIAVLRPQRELALHWHADQAQPGLAIITAFRLEPAGGGTRVIMYESGYDTLPGDVGQALADQAAKGYTASLEALKAHLDEVAA